MNFNKRILISSIIFGFLSTCNGFSSANDTLINSENCVTSNAELNTDINNSANLEKPVELPEGAVSEETTDVNNMPSDSAGNLSNINEEIKIPEDKNVEKVTVPHAILNMSKELSEKPVFYRVNYGDSLSKISEKLLEDPCGWRVILNFGDNSKVIGEEGNLIKANDILIIPQLNDNRFRLYNPQSNETWISISQKFYGSYIWAPYLIKYNDSWGDKPNSYNNRVIKLPSSIYLGDYVLPGGACCRSASYYDQNSFYSLSLFLFGSDKYAKEIAEFNNLPVNRVLNPNQLIHIPPSITLEQINSVSK